MVHLVLVLETKGLGHLPLRLGELFKGQLGHATAEGFTLGLGRTFP
jgi:hypothetical protein